MYRTQKKNEKTKATTRSAFVLFLWKTSDFVVGKTTADLQKMVEIQISTIKEKSCADNWSLISAERDEREKHRNNNNKKNNMQCKTSIPRIHQP